MAGKKRGAPAQYTKWLTEDGQILLRSIARHSLTQAEIAKKMGIALGTLYEWKNKFPEIAEAVKRAAPVVNGQLEDTLGKLCNGFWVEDDDGNRRFYPPNVTAIIFALKNRMPDKYNDRKNIELSGAVDISDTIKAARERVAKYGAANNGGEKGSD